MLPATSRLRRSSEFSQVMRGGKRHTVGRRATQQPNLVLHWYIDASPERSASPPRLGLVISRNVGNAVQRHRLARRLRHIMRSRLAELPAGTDVVIRTLPTAADAGSEQLNVELDALLAHVRSYLSAHALTQHTVPKSIRVSS